jgi:hypothetical protein
MLMAGRAEVRPYIRKNLADRVANQFFVVVNGKCMAQKQIPHTADTAWRIRGDKRWRKVGGGKAVVEKPGAWAGIVNSRSLCLRLRKTAA